jgi:Holliday junction resolvase RusA-like endonuclease
VGEVLDIWIAGEPKPQPRVRAWARKLPNGTAIARVYDAKTAEGWKGAVALAVKPLLPETPLEGPLAVELGFVLPRPQSLMRRKDPDGEVWHTGAGDCDNFAKAVLDALTQVGLWRDDRQVVSLYVTKHYASKTGRSGASLKVESLEPDERTTP